MTNLLHPFIYQLILILVKIICLLVAIAYYTLAERKIMASIQRRRGPNVVGVWGLLQPLADGLKLIAKEIIIPSHSNSRIFVIAPLVILTLGLLTWSIIPFGCYDLLEQTTQVVKVAESGKPTLRCALGPINSRGILCLPHGPLKAESAWDYGNLYYWRGNPKCHVAPRELYWYQRAWGNLPVWSFGYWVDTMRNYDMVIAASAKTPLTPPPVTAVLNGILGGLILSSTFELGRSVYFYLVPDKSVKTVTKIVEMKTSTSTPSQELKSIVHGKLTDPTQEPVKPVKNSLDLISEVNETFDLPHTLRIIFVLISLLVYVLLFTKLGSDIKHTFLCTPIQRRRGPNPVSVLNTITNGPTYVVNRLYVWLFLFASFILLGAAFITWNVVPSASYDLLQQVNQVVKVAEPVKVVTPEVVQLASNGSWYNWSYWWRSSAPTGLPLPPVEPVYPTKPMRLYKITERVLKNVDLWIAIGYFGQVYVETKTIEGYKTIIPRDLQSAKNPPTNGEFFFEAGVVGTGVGFAVEALRSGYFWITPGETKIANEKYERALVQYAKDIKVYEIKLVEYKKLIEKIQNHSPEAKPVETVDSLDVKTSTSTPSQDGKNSLDVISEVNDISDIHYSLLLVLALSSLTVYGLIIAGWASNSKYAFLGALRSAAQMISYEVAINLVILPVITISGSLNFVEIVNLQQNTGWFMIPLSPISLIFFISMIAETNRTPFDLPEAEAELVAGYNVEYSSIIFAIFFLAEYSNMIIMSLLKSLLFLSGWDGAIGPLLPATAFSLKGLVFCFLFVLVRATFPRYRYDQLINIGWKIFLPVATGFLILVVGNLFAFDGLPVLQELNLANYSE